MMAKSVPSLKIQGHSSDNFRKVTLPEDDQTEYRGKHDRRSLPIRVIGKVVANQDDSG